MTSYSCAYKSVQVLKGLASQRTLTEISQKNQNRSPCLYAITGMSNISNTKTPLWIAKRAAELGFHTLLDAAALAPTTRISLRETPIDAMAVSFYKMFGYPTGVGALIVKKDFLRVLRRPWFAGGTVDVEDPRASGSAAHEDTPVSTLNYRRALRLTQPARLSAQLAIGDLRSTGHTGVRPQRAHLHAHPPRRALRRARTALPLRPARR